MDRDLTSIGDIVIACRAIQKFMATATYEQFLEDDFLQSAVLKKLEIIGEATKRISPQFRQTLHQLPWKDMAGIRDRLVHKYDDVDFDIVWIVISKRIPMVLDVLGPLWTSQHEERSDP